MKTKNYESDHASEILSNLNKERTSEENFCDVRLKAGSRDLPAHRCVLSSFSSFFKKLLTVEMKEKYEEKVKLQHVNEETLDDILNFIYTCRISISSENVYRMLEAANFMDITRLKEYCIDFLLEEVDKQNCFSILKYAKMYNMDALVQKVDDVLEQEFEFIITGEEFKDLEFEEVLRMIQMKEKKISSQEVMYHGLINWIKHNVPTRVKFIADMLKWIELEELSGSFLANVVGMEDLVINSVDCMKILFKSTVSRLEISEQAESGQTPHQQKVSVGGVSCRKVGMEDGRIVDSQITASSWNCKGCEPKYGRLNQQPTRGNYGCWIAGPLSPKPGEYIQIALTIPTRVAGVITQGAPETSHTYFTTSYTISYGDSASNMTTVKNSSGNDRVFNGNTDTTKEVINMFPQPVTASFIRLIVRKWNRFPAIRMELLTC